MVGRKDAFIMQRYSCLSYCSCPVERGTTSGHIRQNHHTAKCNILVSFQSTSKSHSITFVSLVLNHN